MGTSRRWVLAILALALAVRLLAVAVTPEFVPVTDAADYDRHGVAIAQQGDYPPSILAPGGGPSAFRPPAYPISLGVVYAAVGTGNEKLRWTAGRVVEALLGVLIVGLIMLLAARFWDRRTALLAGLIAALYPPLVLVGTSLMVEPLYIALMLGALLCALAHRGEPQRWRWPLLAGALTGVAMLTRSNGAVLLPPLMWLVWTHRPRWSWQALRVPLALAATAVLVLVPWTVRNAVVLDAFVPITTQGGYALAGTFNEDARTDTVERFEALWRPASVVSTLRDIHQDRTLQEPEYSAALTERGREFIGEHPAYVLRVMWRNTERMLNLDGAEFDRWMAPYQGYPVRLAVWSVYAFWALGLVALIGAFAPSARRAPLAVWAVPVLMFFSALWVIGLTRYRVPADPFLIVLAAPVLLAVWDRTRAALASRR